MDEITALTLYLGVVGSLTGVISLTWQILKSRSIVIMDSVHFTKADRHTHKIAMDVETLIRNKGSKATTIENVYFEFGRMWIPLNLQPIEVKPGSSFPLRFTRSVTLEEYDMHIKGEKIKLGLTVVHTFGTIKRFGYTNFSTPWLNI